MNNLIKIIDLENFSELFKVIDTCEGAVHVISNEGDDILLTSRISRILLEALKNSNSNLIDSLVISCDKNEDAIKILEFFKRRINEMDEKALNIVKEYIMEHLDKSDPDPTFEVYTVWKAKALQNWKYLISSTLFDGMYYELTYNGDRKEWYLDAYKKFENRVIEE